MVFEKNEKLYVVICKKKNDFFVHFVHLRSINVKYRINFRGNAQRVHMNIF